MSLRPAYGTRTRLRWRWVDGKRHSTSSRIIWEGDIAPWWAKHAHLVADVEFCRLPNGPWLPMRRARCKAFS
jgi:hypothetical protein